MVAPSVNAHKNMLVILVSVGEKCLGDQESIERWLHLGGVHVGLLGFAGRQVPNV